MQGRIADMEKATAAYKHQLKIYKVQQMHNLTSQSIMTSLKLQGMKLRINTYRGQIAAIKNRILIKYKLETKLTKSHDDTLMTEENAHNEDMINDIMAIQQANTAKLKETNDTPIEAIDELSEETSGMLYDLVDQKENEDFLKYIDNEVADAERVVINVAPRDTTKQKYTGSSSKAKVSSSSKVVQQGDVFEQVSEF